MHSYDTWPTLIGAPAVERGPALSAAVVLSRSAAVPWRCGWLVPAGTERGRDGRRGE
jgi:hypothetical protein